MHVRSIFVIALMCLFSQSASAQNFYRNQDLKDGVLVMSNIFSITYHTPWGQVLMTKRMVCRSTWATVERTMWKNWTNPDFSVYSAKVNNATIIRSGLHMYTIRGSVYVDYGKGLDGVTYNFTEVIDNGMGSPEVKQIIVTH